MTLTNCGMSSFFISPRGFLHARHFYIVNWHSPYVIENSSSGGRRARYEFVLVSHGACVLAFDRYGRLNVLFMGLVTLTLATAMYGVASTIFLLYVASGLHGASLSLIHVSSLALLSSFPDRITESMSGIEVGAVR